MTTPPSSLFQTEVEKLCEALSGLENNLIGRFQSIPREAHDALAKSYLDDAHAAVDALAAERKRLEAIAEAAAVLVDPAFGQLDPRAFYAVREALDV